MRILQFIKHDDEPILSLGHPLKNLIYAVSAIRIDTGRNALMMGRLHLRVELRAAYPFHRHIGTLYALDQLLIPESLQDPDLMDPLPILQQLRDDILPVYELSHNVSPILIKDCHSVSSRCALPKRYRYPITASSAVA